MGDSTANSSYSYLFDNYISGIGHSEFLWYAYSKIMSDILNGNSSIFVFITYFIIFGLSAYLVLMLSKIYNTNYLYLLFFLIYINMSFQFAAIHLWRHVITSYYFLFALFIFPLVDQNTLHLLFCYFYL